ncbi:fimbrial protein [Edwardsiella tarda]|uniref:fimbrial protein n=1 Tax=Edwardsiella tarda TaxID=636 RepID=UPI00351C54CA
MKKNIIVTIVSMSMTYSVAIASQGEVQFFGNVSAATCDVAPEISGSVNNLIQLGTVTNGGTGEGSDIGVEVPFTLKAKKATSVGCSALSGTKTATVYWDGPLNSDGIANQSGLATDAVVLLKPTNASDSQEKSISAGKRSATFIENLVNTDGYQFTAQLKGGTVAGDFRSAAVFAVTYH